MATGQDVLDSVVSRSSLNKASSLATADVLRTLSAHQRRAYLLAARLNPNYFGKTGDSSTRASATENWDLSSQPGDIATLTKVEVAAIVGTVSGVAVGDEVHLVDFRWPDLQVSPRGIVRGRQCYGYQTELGTGANYVSRLTLSYSELPPLLTSLATVLRLPEEWIHLVELPLARVFAINDRRLDEIEALQTEYLEVLALFQEAVLTYDHGVTRPLEAVPAIPLRPAAPPR